MRRTVIIIEASDNDDFTDVKIVGDVLSPNGIEHLNYEIKQGKAQQKAPKALNTLLTFTVSIE